LTRKNLLNAGDWPGSLNYVQVKLTRNPRLSLS